MSRAEKLSQHSHEVARLEEASASQQRATANASQSAPFDPTGKPDMGRIDGADDDRDQTG
ncbi:hypothetical protein MALGJ_10230 [Mycolicibacter algericus]|uniref:Uncharacterized protein n=1 Tax=Mycolicibacter algericus TaxID=1288388 RepID=A0A7I9Y6X9_MYCAL|nr:hypothetical protein MALGJ_10230 [Mycolicibacter algericus]